MARSTTRPARPGSAGRKNRDDDDEPDEENPPPVAEETEVTAARTQRRSKRHQQPSSTRPASTTQSQSPPEPAADDDDDNHHEPKPSRKRGRRRPRESDDDDEVPIDQLVARHKKKRRSNKDDTDNDSKSEKQLRRSAIRRSSVQLVTTGAATSSNTGPAAMDSDDDDKQQSLAGKTTSIASSRSTSFEEDDTTSKVVLESADPVTKNRRGRLPNRSRTPTIRTATRPRRDPAGAINEPRNDETAEKKIAADRPAAMETTPSDAAANPDATKSPPPETAPMMIMTDTMATSGERLAPSDPAAAAAPKVRMPVAETPTTDGNATMPTTAVEKNIPAPRDDALVVLKPPADGGSGPRNNNNAPVVVRSEPVETKNGDENTQEPSEMVTHDEGREHNDSMLESNIDTAADGARQGVVATTESNIGRVRHGTSRGDDDPHEEDVVFHDSSHPKEDGQRKLPMKGETTSRVTSTNEQTADVALSSEPAQETEPPSDSKKCYLALSQNESVDSAVADLQNDANVRGSVKDDSQAVSTGPTGAAAGLEVSTTPVMSSASDGKEEHSTSMMLKQEDAPMTYMLTMMDGPMETVSMKQPETSSATAAAQNKSLASTDLGAMPKEVVKEFVARDLAGKYSNDIDPMDLDRTTVDAALQVSSDGAHRNDAAGRMDVVDDKNCIATPSASPMYDKLSEHSAPPERKGDRHSPQLAIENVSSEILAADSVARTRGPTSSNLDIASAESKDAPQDRAPVVRTTEVSLSGSVGKQAQSRVAAVGLVDSLKSDSTHTSQAPQGVGGVASPGHSKAHVSVQEELAQGRTSFELTQILALSAGQTKEAMGKEPGDSTEICMPVAIGAAPAHIRESTENLVAKSNSDVYNQGKVAGKVKAEAAVQIHDTVIVGVEAVSVHVAAETEEKSTAVAQAALMPADTPEAMQIEETQPAVADAEKDDVRKKPGSDLPTESVKIQLDSSILTATGSQINDKDRLGIASDIQSMGKVGAEVPTPTSDQNSSALRENEDLIEVENLRIPMLWPDNEKPVQETRVSLERIKVMIYSAGSRVHAAAGYERMFVAYWKALAMRIGGRLSEAENKKCQRVVNVYLKTKAMRKLHNKLILALLGRCMQPTAPLREISGFIPERLRNRMHIVPKPSTKSHVEKRKRPTTPPGTGEQTEHPFYKPVVAEKVLASAYTHELPLTPASSLRIPGALVIDPRVRQIADAAGMKTSESAIWLLVVALKEFAVTVLGDTLSTMKAVETGLVPRRPSIRPRLLPKKATKSEIASSVKIPAEDQKPATKCISPIDVHITTTGIPNGSKSVGGCFSRTTFERSLVSSYDSSIVVGGNAFQEVKKFFVEAVSSREPALIKTKAEMSVPQQSSSSTSESKVNDKSLRESPLSRDHGHGAKNIASLKARSSISNASPRIESISALAKHSAGSAGSTEELLMESIYPLGDVQQQQQPPQQDHDDDDGQQQRTQNDLERDNASDFSTGESQNVTTPRKGKGFGVKNLAAMRARSVTSQSEDAAEAAKAASVTDETIEPVKSVVPAPAAPVSIPSPTAGTNTLSPSPPPAKKDASPPTGAGVQPGAPREAPTFPQSLTAASIQGQHYQQRTGIKHDISVPYASQNAQMASQSMQNPAVALASAQLAQGLANALIHNGGHASGQRPAMVPYPAQPPQGISLGQLAQMPPLMLSQFPHASAAQLQHHQHHMASSQSAHNIQAMAYAKAFAQNMANVTVANHGTKNPNAASVQAHPATVAPVAAAPEHSPTAQSPAGAGIEPTKPPSSPRTGAPSQPATAASAAVATPQQIESNEARK